MNIVSRYSSSKVTLTEIELYEKEEFHSVNLNQKNIPKIPKEINGVDFNLMNHQLNL